MGDARRSAHRAAPPSDSSTATHVRKLSWFQRNILCMNIDIRREQFQAYQERQLIRSRLPAQPDDPPVSAPLSYERWNSKAKTPWVQLEKDLRATDPRAPAVEEDEEEDDEEEEYEEEGDGEEDDDEESASEDSE